MSGRMQGKLVIVTGGSRGIGRASAELFAEEGATVVVADISEPEAFRTPAISFSRLDVTSEDEWRGLVDSVLAKHGHIDVLMNNAGTVGSYESIDTIAIDDWERVVALNQTGPFLGMRTVIPAMRANGGGTIVNVSSMWGIVSTPGVAAYTASKGAVRLMSKNAALSFVGDGIRVN